MFTVEIGSVITTLLWLQALAGKGEAPAGFIGAVSAWLWFTVLFANFAEALAEGRGKAQAESLKKMRRDTEAKKLSPEYTLIHGREPDTKYVSVLSSSALQKNDLFYVKAGDTIPVDGEVIDGVASVNESAITGESAPVIREYGGDRSAVTGGTSILSDWLIVRVSANPGEGFLDHMIGLIEGAKQKFMRYFPADALTGKTRDSVRRLGTVDEFASFCMPFVDGSSGFTTGQFVAYAGGWA